MRITIIFLTVVCGSLLVYSHDSKNKTLAAGAKSVAQVEQPVQPKRVLLVSVTPAQPTEEPQKVVAVQDQNETVERRNDACIGAVIWGEARGEPVGIDQLMTGYVLHKRSVAGWYGSHDDCFQACKTRGAHREFDSTKRFCALLAVSDKTHGALPSVDENFIEMGREVRTGEFQPPEKCRNVLYFANFAESSAGGIRDFQKHTKIRCVFDGSHLFAEEKPQILRKLVAKVKHLRHTKPVLVALASMTKSSQHKKLAAR